ncbi:YhfC family glutamic-type intramembrane protease [Hyphomicrobium sp.]|uniref:YhfC family glutamic-type intramembrane protease n=1 Tax=Hyphomicrobium sp. TaxID=82 RepID=UPI0025C62D0C|nr:YhfC family glutamic-type intramembrane protease [Hyphomicrobium sp.]MCC7251749.1 YhfC family intramembrane metalloprotease [Hyphomicrobium sp.]
MLAATIPITVALMIVLPVTFAWLLVRRLGTPVSLLLLGATTFFAAQAIRIPVLQALTSGFASGGLPAPDPAYQAAFNIAVLALTAGLFEESARYLAYRHVIPQARSWNAAVTFGAGHGGMESIVLGVLMGVELAGMLAVGSPGTAPLPGHSAEEHARLADQATRYWSTPWYVPLLGALERVFALCFHMAMAVVVLLAVVRRRLAWLAGAIAAHAAANAAGVAALAAYGPVAAEIVVGVIAALALCVLFQLRGSASSGTSV